MTADILGEAAFLVIATALLWKGADWVVIAASRIAHRFGLSDVVIGMTVVAVGTSAPEVVVTLVAALSGHDDIAVANVVGSNIFNVLGIVGATALVRGVPVPPEILARDNLWMIGASLLLFPLMKSDMRIHRGEGAVLLGGFCLYTGLLIASA